MLKQIFSIFILCCLALRGPAAERSVAAPAVNSGARVVEVFDPRATFELQPQPDQVRALFRQGLLQFTQKTNVTLAWATLVSTNDIIGLKVYSEPGANSGTRPSVVAALVETLIEGGISPERIILWDKDLVKLRLAGFTDLAARYKVKVAASSAAGYDPKTFYENSVIGNLIWGDLEFGKKDDSTIGKKSFVTKLLVHNITKIIDVVPLLNHNLAGTTGHLCSVALGSVDNTQRFEQGERLATALPEIYALPSVGDKVILNITDALLCQYQGEQRSLLHYSSALNQLWFSKDPVALDVLAIAELDRQRETAKIPGKKTDLEIYRNASLLELGVSDL
ncbi:MAG: DUF362 domain-containing protein, partial [Verrucomicrobiota bacterium]